MGDKNLKVICTKTRIKVKEKYEVTEEGVFRKKVIEV